MFEFLLVPLLAALLLGVTVSNSGESDDDDGRGDVD